MSVVVRQYSVLVSKMKYLISLVLFSTFLIGEEERFPTEYSYGSHEKLGHCRGTGVVELINGEWKIAHYALTMLVPNSIAADVGAQTQKAER